MKQGSCVSREKELDVEDIVDVERNLSLGFINRGNILETGIFTSLGGCYAMPLAILSPQSSRLMINN